MKTVRSIFALIVVAASLAQAGIAEARPADRHRVVASETMGKNAGAQAQGQATGDVILSPANPNTIKMRVVLQMPTRLPR